MTCSSISQIGVSFRELDGFLLLPFDADVTGEWRLLTDDGGGEVSTPFDAVAGQGMAIDIALPPDTNIEMQVRRPDGSIFNQQCYSFTISEVTVEDIPAPVTGGGTIPLTLDAGTAVEYQDNRLKGVTVYMVCGEGGGVLTPQPVLDKKLGKFMWGLADGQNVFILYLK